MSSSELLAAIPAGDQATCRLRVINDFDGTDEQVDIPATREQLTLRLVRFMRRQVFWNSERFSCCLHMTPEGPTLHWYGRWDRPLRRERALEYLRTGKVTR
jgi:hypothetical protein